MQLKKVAILSSDVGKIYQIQAAMTTATIINQRYSTRCQFDACKVVIPIADLGNTENNTPNNENNNNNKDKIKDKTDNDSLQPTKSMNSNDIGSTHGGGFEGSNVTAEIHGLRLCSNDLLDATAHLRGMVDISKLTESGKKSFEKFGFSNFKLMETNYQKNLKRKEKLEMEILKDKEMFEKSLNKSIDKIHKQYQQLIFNETIKIQQNQTNNDNNNDSISANNQTIKQQQQQQQQQIKDDKHKKDNKKEKSPKPPQKKGLLFSLCSVVCVCVRT